MTSEVAVETARRILGIGRTWSSAIQLIDEIDKGFAVGVLERLCHQVAPDDPTFKYRFVPKSSLHRLSALGHRALLNRQQSEQVSRVARVWAAALDVWGGEEAARRFLNEQHVLLENRTPLEVALSADVGVTMVEDILGRLKYGSAV